MTPLCRSRPVDSRSCASSTMAFEPVYRGGASWLPSVGRLGENPMLPFITGSSILLFPQPAKIAAALPAARSQAELGRTARAARDGRRRSDVTMALLSNEKIVERLVRLEEVLVVAT